MAGTNEETLESGFVKIYRSTMRKSWYRKSEAVHLWVHLIMLATHNEREYLWNGQTIKLKPGQFVTGRKKLSSETGISEGKIRKFLKLFKTDQQISQQISSTSSLISILNYEKYHTTDQQTSQRPTNDRPTKNQRPTTKQERKEREEGEEGKVTTPKISWLEMIKVDSSMQQRFYRYGFPDGEYPNACEDFDIDAKEKKHPDFVEYRRHFNNWIPFYHKTLETKGKLKALNGEAKPTGLGKILKKI